MSVAGSPPVLLGAVLVGGSSRRMGIDKASMLLGGRPMARWVAGVLSEAGAIEVVLVGGDVAMSEAIGLPVIPDQAPRTGPLGGLGTALAWADTHSSGTDGTILLVAACDQPALTARSLRSLTDALGDASASVSAARFLTADGRRQPFPSAWKVGVAVGPIADLFTDGERRIGAAFTVVSTLDLRGDASVLADLDTPGDVNSWTERRSQLPGQGQPRP